MLTDPHRARARTRFILPLEKARFTLSVLFSLTGE
nr:MAG TPA: hypothetical protein [Caudoviricetes sp.]